MFDVNGQYLDLATVKYLNKAGSHYEYYDGPDEVKKLFATVWRDIDQRFLNQRKPVVYKTPSIITMGSAGKEGSRSRGYAFPRSCTVKIGGRGNVRIDWYDTKKVENGATVYAPVTYKIRQENRTLFLDAADIELILAMEIMNPHLSKGNRAGWTFLDDPEADARTYAEIETKNATVAYWLYRAESMFFDDADKLRTLALACGINPDTLSVYLMKQKISEAVKAGEKRGDTELNNTAFDRMCSAIKDGYDTDDVMLSATVHRAMQLGVLKLYPEEFCYKLLKDDRITPAKTLCKVPPNMIDKAMIVLKEHLRSHRDDREYVEMSVDTTQPMNRLEEVVLDNPLPEPEDMTEERVADIEYADMRRLYAYFGESARATNKDKMIPLLVDKLVTQRTKVNWRLRST